MSKINVCILGAGGTMGYKTSRNIAKHPDLFELNVCEIDPEAVSKLRAEGYKVLSMEEAVPMADVVIPSVPDSILKTFAPPVIDKMKSGAALMILDPASVVAGEIHQRDDCALVICHPCHPSFFLDQDTPEARADKYGGDGGKQDLVLSKVSGSDEAFENCLLTSKHMLEPVLHCYVMTPKQMAFLEPTLVEILGATFLQAMADTLDEAVKRGVERAAAISFMSGHIQNLTATFTGMLGDTEVSDACKVAMTIGNRLVLRDDWKRVWDDEVLERVIATMLHPDDPKI